jgi:transcriptional regulator with XRE-family HTH domain
MANMAPRAASPTQGVSTCGIVAPFLVGSRLVVGSVGRAAGRRRGAETQVAVQLTPEMQDQLGLEQEKNHREEHHGQAHQQQQGLPERCLNEVHRPVPSPRSVDGVGGGRGVPGHHVGLKFAAGKQRHLCDSYYEAETALTTTPSTTTTVRQRRLARTLRRLREGAGLTIDQVAEKVELSPSTISRIETAQVSVRTRDVKELLEVYQVTDVQRAELLELARTGRQQHPWWNEYKVLPSVPLLAGLEADAAFIQQYSALLIPGLLQTKEYAAAVIGAIRHDAAPEELKQRLELRMHRQQLLSQKDAPDLWVVLDEAALHRTVGGPAVMHRQLQRLIEASKRPNITIQVLPYSAGPHAGMDGEFTLYSYRDPVDPDVVYLENTGGDLYLEHGDKTSRYRLIFRHLQAAALNPAESVRTLADVQQKLAVPERG